MQAVSDKGGRADFAADADSVGGDQLVAREADQACRDQDPGEGYLCRVEQATYGLVTGHNG